MRHQHDRQHRTDRRETNHDVGGRGPVVDYVPLDDHDRKGLILFADHAP